MTTAYEIPLSAEPQTMRIALAGTTYQLTFAFNRAQGHWVLDIADEDGAPLAQGVAMVTGLDLLAQFRHLGVAGSLVVQTDYDNDAVPGYADLGTTGRLYFVTEP